MFVVTFVRIGGSKTKFSVLVLGPHLNFLWLPMQRLAASIDARARRLSRDVCRQGVVQTAKADTESPCFPSTGSYIYLSALGSAGLD